jgi:lipopolysaccharide biosynthesis regulator YciM
VAEDDTRRWQRMPPPPIARDAGGDPLHALRGAIAAIRSAPHDDEARRRLRALAAEQGSWEQLALLLADEARANVETPAVAAAFYEELADVHENLDQPLETIAAMEAVVALVPGTVHHHDRLAWLYRRAGATVKAAETFEHVATLAKDDRSRAALRAAGKLYREAGKLDRAVAVYRQIVMRRATDTEAWRALEELLVELQRWREVADVRAVLAERATGVEKAVLLRAQARALEQAGDPGTAANLVAVAAEHAPEDVSGLVDYATVLAREGRAQEAADVLGKRIQESVADGAPAGTIAALRMRLVDTLEAAGDRAGAEAALDELLAASPDYAPARERLVEFARRQRADGNLRVSIASFERAAELGSDAVGTELAESRTALGVQLAAADATAGDTDSAERKLRTILAREPLNIEANLALADVLVATNRLHAAIDHLRATLGNAPDDAAPEQLARLVHRTALITRDVGDTDEAHQLLHEAHHLARRDLHITLALGESCFQRKLWRESAIHLGSLADHPDAPANATAVALGLVRAGQAEARALKPANAAKHYEAAARLDPNCAPAWRALADAATQADDIALAIECREHEAAATTDPATRFRLYDALGDACLTLLNDPVRAERAWSAIATAGDAAVLEKLLGLQRKRSATLERGETCERLAALSDDKRAKELTEEAAEAFAAASDRSRARAVADYLVSKYPTDIDTLIVATAIAANDPDTVSQWLRRALATTAPSSANDPRRAELYRRLGDAERARRDERSALDAYQRAVSTARDSDAALAARRGLIDLASTMGRRANTSRLELVEAQQEPADILAAARDLAATLPLTPDAIADARSHFELARALGVELRAEDEQFLDAHPPRPMASDEAYAAALDDAERRALVDDPDDAPLAELLALLGESIQLIAPDANTALANVALSDARRPPSSSDAAVVAMLPQIAKALAGPATLLYASPIRSSPDLTLFLSAPPVIVLGPRLAQLRARSHAEIEADVDTDLRYRLGRIVELARPHRLFAAGVDAPTFDRFVAALVHAFARRADAVPPDVAREADRLHGAVAVATRRRLSDRLTDIAADALDATRYRAGCERAADRSGLIACGHPGYAIHAAGGADKARHLIELAASQRYLAAQRKLRRR